MSNENGMIVCVWVIMLLLVAHVWRHWDDSVNAQTTAKYVQLLYEHSK
jgi:hypothetical protein